MDRCCCFRLEIVFSHFTLAKHAGRILGKHRSALLKKDGCVSRHHFESSRVSSEVLKEETSADSVTTMEATMEKEDFEAKYKELKAMKSQLEQEFGLKRAKFKSMYLDCEAELKEEKAKRETLENRLIELEAEISSMRSDTEGIQAAARLSEEARHEEIAAMKVKHVEEVTSMEHIWQEAVREARATTAKHFDEEYKRLLAANQKLEQQIKGKSEEKPEGIMSMVSQAIKRGSQTSPAQQQPQPQQDSSDDSRDVKIVDTMKEAQENVEAWRSIVMPLEEEIASLRAKLKDTSFKLKQYEAKAAKSTLEGGGSSSASPGRLQEQLKELQGYLDAERSSRTDLEMFIAVLNTQKGVLQEDADKLRSELHNVCRLLEQEKTDHRDLKETWRKANEEFLEQQTMLCWEIENMRDLMTPAQNEKLSRRYRLKHSKPAKSKQAKTIKTVAEEPYSVGNASDDLIKFDDSPKKGQVQIPKPVTPSDVHLSERKLISSEPSSIDSTDGSRESSPSKVSVDRVVSLEEAEEIKEETDAVKPGMRKSASSSDINKELGIRIPSPAGKSLSQGDVSAVIGSSGEDTWAVISSPTVAELEKKMQLNETGWSTMKDSSSTIAHPTCMMCQNYEKQLQRLQRDCLDLKDKKDSLIAFAKKEKLELRAEREKVEKLEKSICVASEDAQTQIQVHAEKESEQQNTLNEIQKQFLAMQEEVHFQVRQLSEDRDRMMAELETLREENASLKTIQETLREDHHHQLSMEGKKDGNVQVMHEKMEQMKLNASTTEEQLRSEIMFLKDRVMAEQFDKENTEKILQLDLDQARQEIVSLKEKVTNQDTGKRKEEPEIEEQPS